MDSQDKLDLAQNPRVYPAQQAYPIDAGRPVEYRTETQITPASPDLPVVGSWDTLALVVAGAVITYFFKPMLSQLTEQFSRDSKDADRFKEFLEDQLKQCHEERTRFLDTLNDITTQTRNEREQVSGIMREHESLLYGFQQSLAKIVTRLEVLSTLVSGKLPALDELADSEHPPSNLPTLTNPMNPDYGQISTDRPNRTRPIIRADRKTD